MSDRCNSIIDFCRSLSQEAHADPGGVRISLDSLTRKGFDIRGFTYDELRAACVGLTYLLLYRGMNMVVTEDHAILWDTIGRELLDPPSLYFRESHNAPFPAEYHAFRELFVTTIKTSTGEWNLFQKHTISKWKWFQMPAEYPEVHVMNPAAYLVYPLLEAVLKETLSSFIERNGIVRARFTVPGRTYNSDGRTRCNRVDDHMLVLLGQQSHLADLNNDLSLIYAHIAFLYPGRDPISVISQEWRNPAMHGEDNISTAFGVVLNIALFIAMDYVKDELKKRLPKGA